MPEGAEESTSADDPAGEVEEVGELNPVPKGTEDVARLFDRLAHLASDMEGILSAAHETTHGRRIDQLERAVGELKDDKAHLQGRLDEHERWAKIGLVAVALAVALTIAMLLVGG